ncbi:hypothetical protein [Demequina sp. NBRC 110057]|uniref:hypothetical protein n=1 Tax=Demequina sp. NBRC 110057 TaxID=1570346 RepID=UPI000A0732B0|nr:hypothetical protein [Demequina sp. NBRC 110057]
MNRRLAALPLAAAVALAACSTDADDTGNGTPDASATATQANPDASPTSQTDASIDVDSGGDPTADAQDAEGVASLGTANATLAVTLPDEWQYEGTYGDGALPYAVLVDASQPFDLSEPGSDAYRESVWVQVETYRVGGESPFADAVADDAAGLAEQLEAAYGGEATEVDGRDTPLVHGTYEDAGEDVEDLYALHGDLWVLARAWNVDVAGYVDGDDVPILTAVLETSEVK